MTVHSAQAWRRWFGLLFLAVSFGMLVWGQTFLKDRLEGMAYLVYWSVCFLFTILAIATALLDILLVRRQSRIARREILKKAFTEVPSGEAPQAERSRNSETKSSTHR